MWAFHFATLFPVDITVESALAVALDEPVSHLPALPSLKGCIVHLAVMPSVFTYRVDQWWVNLWSVHHTW